MHRDLSSSAWISVEPNKKQKQPDGCAGALRAIKTIMAAPCASATEGSGYNPLYLPNRLAAENPTCKVAAESGLLVVQLSCYAYFSLAAHESVLPSAKHV